MRPQNPAWQLLAEACPGPSRLREPSCWGASSSSRVGPAVLCRGGCAACQGPKLSLVPLATVGPGPVDRIPSLSSPGLL